MPSQNSAQVSRQACRPSIGGALPKRIAAPSARCAAKRSGSIESMSSNSVLGTHMCIPPHWEDRRSEISVLEPIDTVETVKS